MDAIVQQACQNLGINPDLFPYLAERGWTIYHMGDYLELRNNKLVQDGSVSARRETEDPGSDWVGEGADTLILHLADAERQLRAETSAFDLIVEQLAKGGQVDVVVDGKTMTLASSGPIKIEEFPHIHYHACLGTPEADTYAFHADHHFPGANGHPAEIVEPERPLTAAEAAALTPEQCERWRLKVTTDAKTRKGMPLATGLLDYFPDACLDVSRLSRIGNQQHNPGEPMHWARGKSSDQRDTIARHTLESGIVDIDKVLHATKVAWRALAEAQLAIERLRAQGIEYPPKEV